MQKTIIGFVLSLAILWGMLYIGKGLNILIPIGIPDSIWGLLVLFFALITGLLKLEWVLPTGRFLNRYMPIVFLPICVGMVEYGDILTRYFSSLIISNILSTIITIVIVGWVAQRLFKDSGDEQ
ncbi:CidA/LrgA family protein [Actinobacillus vicugnae]|uniref:CidA/LrgA family protein n=1 Tax=Actinobacillus vicugnae TaxID=2573093 RepID=UPI0012419273|nr:CidA/LrgA family protein [Actinobacillus vicugnae]